MFSRLGVPSHILHVFAVLGIATTLVALRDAGPGGFEGGTFAGQQVRIIVNFGAGGTTDLYARTLAPFLSKHLPGQPVVYIENKPGADGILGASYAYGMAKPDGLTLCLCNGVATRWATRKDFAIDVRQFVVLGSTQENSILLAWDGLNVAQPADLSTYDGRFLFATHSAIAPGAVRTRLLLEAVGSARLDIVGGYWSANKSLAATRRGETNLTLIAPSFYLPQADQLTSEGGLRDLAQLGYLTDSGRVRRSRDIDSPTYDEIWRALAPDSIGSPAHRLAMAFYMASSVQRLFALPPGTDERIAEAWESALAAALADPGYVAMRKAQGAGEIVYLDGAKTRARLARIMADFQDPEVLSVLADVAPALRKG